MCAWKLTRKSRSKYLLSNMSEHREYLSCVSGHTWHLQNIASTPVNSFLVLSKHVSENTHQPIEQSGGFTNSLPLAAAAAADNTKPFIHSTINTSAKNEHLQAPGHFGSGYLEQPRQAYLYSLFLSVPVQQLV